MLDVAVADNLNVSSAPIEIPLLFFILISKLVVLITSDLRNLPACTSTPEMDNASAFLAVPFSTGKNPPTKFAISLVVVGALMFIPDLIISNPVIKVFGVKLSLLNTITGMSAI